MIDFRTVSKSYGEQDLLDNVTFRINQNERVGIVGPNGAGKTTIFRIITDESTPDSGTVSMPRDLRIGYLRQHLDTESRHLPLLDFVADALAEIKPIEAELHRIESRLADGEADPEKQESLLKRMGELQLRFESLGGYDLRQRAKIALGGLGFSAASFRSPLSTFSGGWQMRAALARVLISVPDILLLDEPSNYLDVPAVEWLQRHLRGFAGTLLLISHDRFLLRSLCEVTLEVNGGMVTRYSGNIDQYFKEREVRFQALESAKRNQDRERERVQQFINRFRATSTKASQVQSRIKALKKMEEIKLPVNLQYHGEIRIPPVPPSGHELLRLEQVSFSYDGKKNVLENIDLVLERGDKFGIVGYNGTGKTTLLRILADALKPTKGKRRLGHHAIIGYQAQEFGEILPPRQRVIDILSEAAPNGKTDQELRTVLGSFGFFGEQTEKTCEVLSGGEKIRLAFARIFINPPNLLILDEPTTHLDMATREALQQALSEYEGTVCFVSHDIEFVRQVATTIIAITPPCITRYYGGYEYYREKVMQAEKGVSGTVGEKKEGATAAEPDEPMSREARKAGRRERAERRKKVARQKKELEKTILQAETRMEKLEIEQSELMTELWAVSDRKGDFARLNRRLKEIQQAITGHTEEWEQASLELEELLVSIRDEPE